MKFLSGPVLALMVWLLPFALPWKAHAMAGIMVWVMVWWIFEVLPLAATGLLGTVGAVFLGIADIKTALAPFAHPLVFLFMGGFILARAMTLHGLDRRIALTLLNFSAVKGHPWRTLAALAVVTGFLSMWISNTATTAMMLPIATGVLASVFPGDALQRRARGDVLLAVAYASSIGGIATPIGSTPNLIGIAFLKERLQIQFTFFEWMAKGLPLALILGALLLWVLRWRLPSLPERVETGPLENDFRRLGPLSVGEKSTAVAAGVAVVLWVLPGLFAVIFGKEHHWTQFLGAHLPEAAVAVFAALLLFIFPGESSSRGRRAIVWKEAMMIDWNSLLLFGGGLSLGGMLFQTGLATVVGDGLGHLATGPLVFSVAVIVFALFFTETTSNTATANLLVPIILAGAQQGGFSAVGPTFGAILACSLAFMMPVSTPPNAIVYGSGEVDLPRMMGFGLGLNLLAVLVLVSAVAVGFLG